MENWGSLYAYIGSLNYAKIKYTRVHLAVGCRWSPLPNCMHPHQPSLSTIKVDGLSAWEVQRGREQ